MPQRTRSDVSSSPPSLHDIQPSTNGNTLSSSSSSSSSRRESTTTPRARNISHKIHLVTVIICLVIICLNRYQKALRAIDSSSFFQEDKSFHPPLFLISSDQKQQQQQQESQSHRIRHQRFYNNTKYTFNDDDYPPPREIIRDDKEKEKRKQQYRQELYQRQQQQKQNSITAQRLQSIQKFRNAAGISTTSSSFTAQTTAQTKPKATNTRQFYDIVNGKKTLIYKRLYPRVLYFVHIHKSAGTLICNYAYKNRLSSEHMRNCNVQEDQHCCGNSDTIEAQIKFANTTYYDFVAIEREMYDSMAPDHYDYIACIRNSKARYFSHWGHLRRLVPADLQARKRTGGYGTSAWIMNDTSAAYAALPSQSASSSSSQQQKKKKSIADLPKILLDVATNSRGGRGDPLGSFQMWYKLQPDNWNTRVFCGPKCMSIPKYQISKELFGYVLQRLEKFKHFIFVENITSSINKMADYYGWKVKHNESHVKNQRYDYVEAKKQLSKQIWDYKMSVLDDAIYEFATRKYNNVSNEELWSKFTNQNDIDKYFDDGPSNGCTNACCGECSLY